jgi:hypothetical protein
LGRMEICRGKQPWEASALPSKRMETLSVLSMQSHQSAPHLFNGRQDTLDQVVYKRQQLKAFQSSSIHRSASKMTSSSATQLTARSIRTAHLVAKNTARNSLRLHGSAVKADATASAPSRPTASRCFAIAGQVRGRRTEDGCSMRLFLSCTLWMHFRYFGNGPCPT